jgi:hypothetical protein
VRVHRADGSWVPVDTMLRRSPDGAVVPTASPVDLRLSGGGTGPLVSMSRGGRSIALSWPSALPAPVLAADTATYAEVLPGVDLTVRATLDGFSDVLVVKSAAAAARPELTRVHFGLSTVGVSATVGPAGELSAVDGAGRPVFAAPPAQMWDSAVPAGRAAGLARRTGAAATSSPRAPGSGARRARMPVRLAAGGLDVIPDRRVLAGARFPVFIDPETTYNYAAWTEVNANRAGSVWRTADNLPAAGHAYDNFGTYTVRSFFSFNTSSVRGAHILDARFRTYLIHSWSCQARPVELWSVPASFGSGTTWNSQPAWAHAQWQSTLNVAKGYSGCAAGTIGFVATKGVAAVAAARSSTIALGLKASNESDVYGWKKFDITNPQTIPQLDVTFDFAPNPLAAKDLSTDKPRTHCVSDTANAPRISVPSTGMTVQARATDPDGSATKIRVNFEWVVGSTGTRIGGVTTADGASGSLFTATLPRSAVNTDQPYWWRANVQDINPDTHQVMTTTAWSPWCVFVQDSVRPLAPVIVSPSYPGGAAIDGYREGIGTEAYFYIDPEGVDDVDHYVWSLNQDRGLSGTVLPGGSPTLTITPDRAGLNKLYIRSVDRAGLTQTASEVFEFDVPQALAQPIGVYRFDDDTDDSSSFGGTAPAGAGTSLVPGRVGNALHLDGTTNHVTASTRFNPRGNFSVSAWVKLDSAAASATAVSGDGIDFNTGVTFSNFDLGYRADTHHWAFTCEGVAAQSTTTAAAGVWTLLTAQYDIAKHQMSLLVNGQVEAHATVDTIQRLQQYGNLQIGHSVGAGNTVVQRWPGSVDEVRVFDRMQLPTEVALLGQWGLDSNGHDDSPAARDVVPAADATFGPDRFGLPAQALTVQGTANGYAATAGPVLRTNASYTVSAWVRVDSKATTGIAVCQFGSRGAPFYLQYRADLDRFVVDLPAADADATSVTRLQGTASPPVGVWAQLVFVYDAGVHKARLYVGTIASIPVLQQEVAYTASWNATGPLNIGRLKIQGAARDFWKGGIDDVVVYGDALTDYELTQLS